MPKVYYGYQKYKTPISRVDDKTIPSRIDALIANPDLNECEKDFCNSIKAGWVKYNSLTENQYKYFASIETKHSAENVKASSDWKANFSEEHRKRLKICAEYYSTTRYFKDIVKKALNDKEWIPTEKQYRAMCENKYANRLIENMNTEPKFQAGNLVTIASGFGYIDSSGFGHIDSICMVVEIEDGCTPTRGSRTYRVLPFGQDRKYRFEERHLRLYRKSKKEKV